MRDRGKDSNRFSTLEQWKAGQVSSHNEALRRNGGVFPESGSAFSSGPIQTDDISLGDRVSYTFERGVVLGLRKGRELLNSLGRKISQATRPNRVDLP